MTSNLLNRIEAGAKGELRGLGVFAHPNDTLILVAEVRKLREALKPFAEYSADPKLTFITVSDYRKAAEVLR